MPNNTEQQEADFVNIPNKILWSELQYIRKKVDSLEQKVLYMFGGFSVIVIVLQIVKVHVGS